MALEDKIDRLTAVMERHADTMAALLDALKGATALTPIVTDADIRELQTMPNSQSIMQVSAPARPRGRPRKGTPVEPVNTAPPPPTVDESTPFDAEIEEAERNAVNAEPDDGSPMPDHDDETFDEPETVAPAVVAAPPRSVTAAELRDKVLEVKEKVGVAAAQACVHLTGFAKLAELGDKGTPEQWLAAYDAAVEALATAEEV